MVWGGGRRLDDRDAALPGSAAGGVRLLALSFDAVATSTQVTVHWVLLLAATGQIAVGSQLWPTALTPGRDWVAADLTHPVRSVIQLVLASAGLPFSCAVATAPLIQKWACTSAKAGGPTALLHLEVGSLFGLLSYPFWIESALECKITRRYGAGAWRLRAACGACGWKFRSGRTGVPAAEADVREFAGITPMDYAMWFALARVLRHSCSPPPMYCARR